MKNTELKIPTQLVEDFTAGNGVLWLGAGCSVGSGLPSWEGLIRSMLQRLKDDGDIEISEYDIGRSVTNLEVAQLFKNLVGEHSYYDFLRAEISGRTMSTVSNAENETLRAVTKLINHFWPKPGLTVVSTNYDTILEELLLVSHGKKSRAIVTKEDLATANFEKDLNILKPNGSIDSPGSIILTLQDYYEYRHRKPNFVATLSDLFLKKTFLFVGYGMGDFTFNSILGELRSSLGDFQRRAYVIAKDEWGIKKEVLNSLGLEVLPISDFNDIPFILQAILQEQTTVDIVTRKIDQLPNRVLDLLSDSSLLLVEDDQQALEMISRIFRHYDWKGYAGIDNPEKALKKIQREAYDFIVTDLAMPGISGVELIKKIRKTSKNKNAIVAVWSGYLKEDICLEAGADFCFQKPTRIEEIFRILFLLKRMKNGKY